MDLIDHIKRLDDELECLWTEIPAPGDERRDDYLNDIDRLSKIRETLVKQVHEENKSDEVFKWTPVVLSAITGIFIPLIKLKKWDKVVHEAWVNEDKTILSSQTSKNYVMKGLSDLFRI